MIGTTGLHILSNLSARDMHRLEAAKKENTLSDLCFYAGMGAL